MGSTTSKPIESPSSIMNETKQHISPKQTRIIDNKRLINAFVISFENEFNTKIPIDLIPIIIYYFQQIDGNWFEINKSLNVKHFKFKQLTSFGKRWKVEMKCSKTIHILQILKKKNLKIHQKKLHQSSERKIISNINHPFISSITNAFETKCKLFLVMDFFDGKELFSYIPPNQGRFSELQTRFYAAEICLAIEYIHQNNIIYGDLKPSNILLDKYGHIKITDIDISISDGYLIHVFHGSPEYLAPEMLQTKYDGYDKMMDWWAFGIILYEMICGISPYYDQDIQKIYDAILSKPVPFYSFMSVLSIDLISKLLKKSPKQRINCTNIKRNRFFESINWNKLYKKQIPPPLIPNDRVQSVKITSVENVNRFERDEEIYSFVGNYECYQRQRPTEGSVLLCE